VTVHVALLRAVNLGPHNKLPMKDLAAFFSAAGAKDVRTFINSGNVVFTAPDARVAGIGKKVRAAIEERFGFDAPIVFRSAAEMKKVARGNPFATDEFVHVTFLADAPDKKGLVLLEPKRHPSEELVVRGRDLYLRLPKGVGHTKIVASVVDKALGTFGTTRNFRTVTTLADLASAEPTSR
jgi:uncharacterized protein (DUF1697 family)